MSAPYDGRKIANLLLDSFDSVQWEISNKKMNKVLFFVHGVGLSRLNYPLVRNHIEAWDHGPVVDVVYHSFKEFERLPITRKATAFSYVNDQEETLSYDDIDERDRNFIVRVAAHYLRHSADELEAMTHEIDTPWTIVRSTSVQDRGIRNRIPDELIRGYFVKRLGAPVAVN